MIKRAENWADFLDRQYLHSCPFNLHPIFSFEKMGAFATMKKIGYNSTCIFSGWQPEKKLGFIK
jgi:hypothetical protein